jgi:hypothetical protein
MTGVKVRVKAVLLIYSEPGTGWARDGIQESTGFSQNIKKSSIFIVRDKGLVLVLVLALIILLIIKDI